MNRLRVYQIRIIIFIQEPNLVTLSENIKLYNQAEAIIVPSLAMRRSLLDKGIKKGMKFVIQEMWDYIIDMANCLSTPPFVREIHFVGNNGIGQICDWNYALPLKLYTDLGIQGHNVQSSGDMSRGEVISELSRGGFGLVWYSNEDERHREQSQ